MPMTRTLVVPALLLTIVLTACSPAGVPDQAAVPVAPVAGGAATLPGDLPEGTTFEVIEEGVDAPGVDLELVDGTTVSLADYRDRPVVLVFFASWCQWCTEHQAELNELADAGGDKVLFMGITGTDDAERAAEYAAEHELSYPVALDPDLTVHRAFAVQEPPLVALIAPGGKLVRGWQGGVSPQTLADALADFSGGEE